MPVIHLETLIDAPRDRVFDLARSIDLHQESTRGTSERAVAGVTSGLLDAQQQVTWEARHLGIKQRLTSKMTVLERPHHFQDVMLKGAFARMKHDHLFEERNGKTLMIDRFDFASPLGILGKFIDWIFLTGYMRRFIEQRNAFLKQTAESSDWKRYLKHG